MRAGAYKQIAWVVASLIVPPVNPEALKEFGPIWGGWQTWDAFNTDNVVCADPKQAAWLVEQSFHTWCNLYAPTDSPASVRAAPGVNLFHRPANAHGAVNIELISLLRQASVTATDVYLLGMPEEFDLGDRRAISAVVSATPAVNWVQLDSGTMYLSPDQFRNFSQSNLQCELESLKRR